jgi:transposase
MVKAYSIDLRARVVRFVEAGNSCHEASRRVLTSPSFVINLMDLWRQTGSLQPRKQGSQRPGKLAPHREFILAQVTGTPDMTMPELPGELKGRGLTVDPASLSHFLLRNGLSYKKTVLASETRRADVRAAREEWKDRRQARMAEEPGRLVFVDETWTKTNMARQRGRSRRGERLKALVPFGHWNTQTFIAGLRCHGLTAPWVIDGPVNRRIFETGSKPSWSRPCRRAMSSFSIIFRRTKAQEPNSWSGPRAHGSCSCRPIRQTSTRSRWPSPN